LESFTASILLSLLATTLLEQTLPGGEADMVAAPQPPRLAPGGVIDEAAELAREDREGNALLRPEPPPQPSSHRLGLGRLCYGLSSALAIAALVALYCLWQEPIVQVDMRPLHPHSWSLRSGLAHIASTNPLMATLGVLLLITLPAVTMVLVLMAPWSLIAYHAALHLSDVCCLDVFAWAMLVYKWEEDRLVTLLWPQRGLALLLAASTLVPIAVGSLRCAPAPRKTSCSNRKPAPKVRQPMFITVGQPGHRPKFTR